jgi:hypothetical protein
VRKAAPAPPPAPPPPVEADPFDFGGAAAPAAAPPDQALRFESDDAGLGRVRVRARTGAAANWLTTGAALVFLDSIGFCILGIPGLAGGLGVRPSDAGAVAVVLLILFLVVTVVAYVPMVIILLGARSLRSQRSYALALTGAVLAIVVSIPALLGGGGWFLFTLWFLAMALANQPAGAVFALFPLAIAAALLAAGLCCLTGAIQSFRALANPEVAEAFRRRKEKRS